MTAERLQKLIARAGIASRRKAEELILAGRVRVNGRVLAVLGAQADPERDRIEVDGRRLAFEAPVTFLLYKPRGVLTTLSDPEGRRTVLDIMKSVHRRIFPVGRLDYNVAGALLLTSDGDLANGLLHPRSLVPRVYRVKVKGIVPDEVIARIESGVDAGGSRLRAARAHRLGTGADNTWLSVTVHDGRSDLIGRICEALGLRVMRLTRTAFAGVTVDGMAPGDYRQIDRKELASLRRYGRLPDPRTRTVPPPPGWDRPPPEDARGEQDDGSWAAWDDGSVWELLHGTDGDPVSAPVADGVVRRERPAAAASEPAPYRHPESGDRAPPARRGRLPGVFDDDGWEVADPHPLSRRRSWPAGSPAREAPGRPARAFRTDRHRHDPPRPGGPPRPGDRRADGRRDEHPGGRRDGPPRRGGGDHRPRHPDAGRPPPRRRPSSGSGKR